MNSQSGFSALGGDDVAITMCPITQPVVIVPRSLIVHATFLHHASGRDILSFTFRVDHPDSELLWEKQQFFVSLSVYTGGRHLSPQSVVEGGHTYANSYNWQAVN